MEVNQFFVCYISRVNKILIVTCCYSARAMPERISFRAYTAIMYLDPRMKIYIQVGVVMCSVYTNELADRVFAELPISCFFFIPSG